MLSRAQLSVKFSLDRLRLQIAEYKDEQFPGDHSGPPRWLAVLAGVLDTAEDYLNRSKSTALDEAQKASLIRDAGSLACEVYKDINEIRGASISDLPYPIVAPLDRWFNELGIQSTTVFRAELLANYELKPISQKQYHGIRNKSASLSAALNDASWPLLRVTVPSQAFGILPHFAIVAHELGHALYSNINWDQTRASSKIQDVARAMASQLNVSSLDQGARNMLMEIVGNWFEEVAADAFAYFLTGPAIFFSLSEFASILGGSGLSHTHPAMTLRRRILFEELQKGDDSSFAQIFENHTGVPLTEDFNSATLTPPGDKQSLYALATQVNLDPVAAAALIELNAEMLGLQTELYNAIGEYLRRNASDSIYSPDKFDVDLDVHLEPMLAAIPPIEVKTEGGEVEPTEFASILNVGWVAMLTKLPDLRVKTDGDDPFGSKRMEILHGLLLKGVELSEARRAWNNA